MGLDFGTFYRHNNNSIPHFKKSCVWNVEGTHLGLCVPICKEIRLDDTPIPIFFSFPNQSTYKRLQLPSFPALIAYQVLLPAFMWMRSVGNSHPILHLLCACTHWMWLDTHYSDTGLTVISWSLAWSGGCREALLVPIHSPTLLKDYFTSSPPSFTFTTSFLSSLSPLTLHLLHGEKRSHQKRTSGSQDIYPLPAPETWFSALSPVNDRNTAGQGNFFMCALHLILSRRPRDILISHTVLSLPPVSSILLSLLDHSHWCENTLWHKHGLLLGLAPAPVFCCLLQENPLKKWSLLRLRFLSSKPSWITPIGIWLHRLAKSTLEVTGDLHVFNPIVQWPALLWLETSHW